jgi:hypothetical protein
MRPNDASTLYNAACTYGLLELKVEALAMLRRAIDCGFSDIEWISRDTDLACLTTRTSSDSLERIVPGTKQA